MAKNLMKGLSRILSPTIPFAGFIVYCLVAGGFVWVGFSLGWRRVILGIVLAVALAGLLFAFLSIKCGLDLILEDFARRVWARVSKRRFIKIFGFTPIGTMRPAQQKVVDKNLILLALRFAERDQAQRILLAKEPSASSNLSLAQAFNQMARAERRVAEGLRKAKRDFWSARDFAKQEGFSVEDTYGAYLSKGRDLAKSIKLSKAHTL